MTNKNEELLAILRDGLAPALGCTEPIALAFSTASAAKKTEGNLKKIKIRVNRNIYKNGLRVGIPGTDKTGLYIAAALGYLIGEPEKELEVIEKVSKDDVKKAEKLLDKEKVEIKIAEGVERLYIETIIETEKNSVRSITLDKHLNIVKVEKSDKFEPYEIPKKEDPPSKLNIKKYSFKDILEFADKVDLDNLSIIERGIKLSYEIIEEGREKGTTLASSLQKMIDEGITNDNMMNRAQLLVAIASEARMTGCKKAVMSNSGSGNQGLTAFLSILGAAEIKEVTKEKLYRSLVVSNLVTIYIKSYLGVLSAMCGAVVAAGTASSVATVYLLGGNREEAFEAAKNFLGVLTGTICDGAKDGCAYKASLGAKWAVQSALLALDGTSIPSNNGVLADNFEDMIKYLGRINQGMISTDESIMEIMLENE